MSKNKKSFSNTYRSLTDIGEAFNLSAVMVGKELKRLGYRNENGVPTEDVLNKKMAVLTPMKDKKEYYRWNIQMVHEILDKHYKRDNLAKCRKIIKEMIKIIRSEEWKYGGGFEYKISVEYFFDLVNKLPFEELRSLIDLVNNSKVNKDEKEYLLSVFFHHIIEQKSISENQINIIFEFPIKSVMQALSTKKNLNDTIRKKAENFYI